MLGPLSVLCRLARELLHKRKSALCLAQRAPKKNPLKQGNPGAGTKEHKVNKATREETCNETALGLHLFSLLFSEKKDVN